MTLTDYLFIMLSYSKYTHTKKKKVHKRKEKTINY